MVHQSWAEQVIHTVCKSNDVHRYSTRVMNCNNLHQQSTRLMNCSSLHRQSNNLTPSIEGLFTPRPSQHGREGVNNNICLNPKCNIFNVLAANNYFVTGFRPKPNEDDARQPPLPHKYVLITVLPCDPPQMALDDTRELECASCFLEKLFSTLAA